MLLGRETDHSSGACGSDVLRRLGDVYRWCDAGGRFTESALRSPSKLQCSVQFGSTLSFAEEAISS